MKHIEPKLFTIQKLPFVPLILATLFCLPVQLVQGQDVDESRMNRDIKVMGHALTEMLSDELDGYSGNYHFNSAEKGKYIPGFGIMLRFPKVSGFSAWSSNGQKKSSGYAFSGKEFSEEEIDKMVELIKDFMVNYGDLASQLSPEENLMVHLDSDSQAFPRLEVFDQNSVSAIARVRGQKNPKLSVKVQKKYIDQFKEGKIDEEALKSNIVVEKGNAEEGSDRSFKVLAKILQSIYERDYDSRPFFSGEVSDNEEEGPEMFYHKSNFSGVEYDFIQGMGVMYQLKLGYPLKGYDADLWRWSGEEGKVIINLDDLGIGISSSDDEDHDEEADEVEEDDEEDSSMDKEYLRDRDEMIEKIYPNFKSEMVRQIVEYGRTLKGLESDEFLIINVEMPACFECRIPAQVEFKARKSLLEDFDGRKIGLNDALDQVIVSESGKASELMDFQKRKRVRVVKPRRVIRGRSYRHEK